MLYVRNDSDDPWYNLALEEYLLKNQRIKDIVLLLWQNRPSVIIGQYQNTIEEINSDFVDKNQIQVVRRITGGGAVYHDRGNLNYSFIIPDVDDEINFKKFTQPLIEAMASMGVKAELTGRNDILVDGKKFSGNAQFYYQSRLLHHGTILFDSNLDFVQNALCVKPGKIESKSIKSVRSRVTNLKPYLKKDMDVLEFKQALLDFFVSHHNVNEYVLTEQDTTAVNRLVEEKYSTWAWTYEQSPACNIVRSAYFSCGYIEFHFQVERNVIQTADIRGDFFSRRDIGDFLDLFVGKPFEREILYKLLQTVDITMYLGEVSAIEILNVIY